MLKGLNNITLPVYKELLKKISEVKESGIDISKIPQLDADPGTLTEEQFNSVKGKIWFSISGGYIVYPGNNTYFYIIYDDSCVEIIAYDGTGEEFNVNISTYILPSQEKYDNIPNNRLFSIVVCTDSSQGDYFLRILMFAQNYEEVITALTHCCSKTTGNNYRVNIGSLNFSDKCINVSYFDIDGGNDNTRVRYLPSEPCQFEFTETDVDEHLYEVTNNFRMPVTETVLDGESLLADVPITSVNDIIQSLIDNDYIYINQIS